jgi:hypothetical protein
MRTPIQGEAARWGGNGFFGTSGFRASPVSFFALLKRMTLVAGVGWAGGCRTTAGPPPGAVRESCHIAVRQSDPENRYVILECLPVLAPGTEIDLYRGDMKVARVVMTSSRRGGLSVASWLSGEPAAGDLGQPSLVNKENPWP